ncbi:MAG: hypothetical protein KAV82_09945 [Phycisphaerae bacterium]|nr:hypothetical protein [Phycisphaerae bacterium]
MKSTIASLFARQVGNLRGEPKETSTGLRLIACVIALQPAPEVKGLTIVATVQAERRCTIVRCFKELEALRE